MINFKEKKYYVITTWGQVLDWDEDKNIVFARNFSNNFPTFYVSNENNIFCFEQKEQNHTMEPIIFSDGSLGCGEKELIPTKIIIKPINNYYFNFSFNGIYLSSDQSGITNFCRSNPDSWEKYRFISHEDYIALNHIFSEKWYIPSLKLIEKFNLENRYENFMYGIHNIIFNIDDIIDSFSCNFPKELIIPHDGWKLEKLVLYKPLIYYCCFGREEGFLCLNMSIKSLRDYGDYDGEIKIITDKNKDLLRENYDYIIDDNVSVLPYKALDHIDFMSARFDIPLYEEVDAYQPILYLDTDIIISSPVGKVLDKIMESDVENISVLKETDLPFSEGYWGKELFEEDFYSTKPKYGFTTGIILYRNNEKLKSSFLSVRKTIERQSLTLGCRDTPRCYDQPIANYIMHKFEKIDYKIMEEYACNFDIRKANVDDIEYEQYVSSLCVSIVHFCGGVGAYHWKLNAMKRFFDWLMAREILHVEGPKNPLLLSLSV